MAMKSTPANNKLPCHCLNQQGGLSFFQVLREFNYQVDLFAHEATTLNQRNFEKKER